MDVTFCTPTVDEIKKFTLAEESELLTKHIYYQEVMHYYFKFGKKKGPTTKIVCCDRYGVIYARICLLRRLSKEEGVCKKCKNWKYLTFTIREFCHRLHKAIVYDESFIDVIHAKKDNDESYNRKLTIKLRNSLQINNRETKRSLKDYDTFKYGEALLRWLPKRYDTETMSASSVREG